MHPIDGDRPDLTRISSLPTVVTVDKARSNQLVRTVTAPEASDLTRQDGCGSDTHRVLRFRGRIADKVEESRRRREAAAAWRANPTSAIRKDMIFWQNRKHAPAKNSEQETEPPVIRHV